VAAGAAGLGVARLPPLVITPQALTPVAPFLSELPMRARSSMPGAKPERLTVPALRPAAVKGTRSDGVVDVTLAAPLDADRPRTVRTVERGSAERRSSIQQTERLLSAGIDRIFFCMKAAARDSADHERLETISARHAWPCSR
jgi:hypothetical protein